MSRFNPIVLLLALTVLTLTSANPIQDASATNLTTQSLDARDGTCSCQDIRDQIKWCNCDNSNDCLYEPTRCYNVKCCLDELWLPGMPTPIQAGRCKRILQYCSIELPPPSVITIKPRVAGAAATDLPTTTDTDTDIDIDSTANKKTFMSYKDLPSEPQWNAEKERWEII